MFVVEGRVLIDEAIRARWSVLECYASSAYLDEKSGPSISSDTPVYELDPRMFESVSDTKSPQGVLAIVSMNSPFVEATHATGDTSPEGWFVVADGISDPGNLGTILRSAEAAGASRLALLNNSVDPFSPKVVRSSAGALFHLPVSTSTYEELVADRCRLLGLTSHETIGKRTSYSMYDVSVDGHFAVVVGSEAHGIAHDAPIDDWVTIPHVGRAESLNAAMAATVMCMHIAHVRSESVPPSTDGLH